MPIRVVIEAGKTITIVRIQGRLTSADVCDVRAACEAANTPLQLDLSDLISADGDGIRSLCSLSETGAELYGANPYVRQLLLEANKCDASS